MVAGAAVEEEHVLVPDDAGLGHGVNVAGEDGGTALAALHDRLADLDLRRDWNDESLIQRAKNGGCDVTLFVNS